MITIICNIDYDWLYQNQPQPVKDETDFSNPGKIFPLLISFRPIKTHGRISCVMKRIIETRAFLQIKIPVFFPIPLYKQ